MYLKSLKDGNLSLFELLINNCLNKFSYVFLWIQLNEKVLPMVINSKKCQPNILPMPNISTNVEFKTVSSAIANMWLVTDFI